MFLVGFFSKYIPTSKENLEITFKNTLIDLLKPMLTQLFY